jgi:hypothetical protein
MPDQRNRNRKSEEEIQLDILGTRKGNSVRITGTIYNQFAIPGVWLRGTLHCHLGSHRRPEWVAGAADHYRRLGYDFLAGMDHNRISLVNSVPDILVIPGAEISGPGHVLAYGLDQPLSEPDRGGDPIERTAATIRKIKEKGGVAVLAHPFKSGYTWDQLNLLCDAGLDGMEILNSNVRGKGADAGRADQIWHMLLREGRSLVVLGNDDAHGPHEDLADSGLGLVSHAGWTGVLAREFSVAGVIDAIRERRTYASEGPQIMGIEFREDGKLVVFSSPCVACHFRSVGGGRGGSSVYPDQGKETSEQFVFDLGVAGYRVQDRLVIILEDAFGRRAWVSPISINLTLHEVLGGTGA